MTMIKSIKLIRNLLININKTNIFFSMDFIFILALKFHVILLSTSFFPMEEQFLWQKMVPTLLTLLLTEKISFSKKLKNTFNLNGFMIRSTSKNFSTSNNIGLER